LKKRFGHLASFNGFASAYVGFNDLLLPRCMALECKFSVVMFENPFPFRSDVYGSLYTVEAKIKNGIEKSSEMIAVNYLIATN